MRYLCKKTTQHESYCYKYLGSGKLWLRHLNKHGTNISTEILERCTTKAEFITKADQWCKELGVPGPGFANLIPEHGDGGDTWTALSMEGRSVRSEKMKKAMKGRWSTISFQQAMRDSTDRIREFQLGKTMKERLGSDYVDPREGKSRKEIHKSGIKHAQIKPFELTLQRTQQRWVFDCESDCAKTLHIYPDPTIRKLKAFGRHVIGHRKLTTKHPFQKGDVLLFRFI